MTTSITVLGIGNILLQDDGFGVKAVARLQEEYDFPAQVTLLDGGTLGTELTYFLRATERLVVLDAVAGGKAPGTWYEFTGAAVEAYFTHKVSLHDVGLRDVLAALAVTGRSLPETVIFGVEPASIAVGLELSPPVAAMLPRAVAATVSQLAAWQAPAVRKQCRAGGV